MTDTSTPVLTAEQIDQIGRSMRPWQRMMGFARAIERAAINAYQRQQWVSVEDRLPPDDETWVYAMHIDSVFRPCPDGPVQDARAAWRHGSGFACLPTSELNQPLPNPLQPQLPGPAPSSACSLRSVGCGVCFTLSK